MPLMSIVLKIYNRTRPPHQLNTEHYIFTNTLNHCKIMPDRQIIPDSNSVIRCLDPEMLEPLDSHGTFILSEFLEMLKEMSIDNVDSIDRSEFLEKLTNTITKTIQEGHSQQYLMSRLSAFLKGSIFASKKDNSKINNALLFGMNCDLLQPDGKGWQKGKLKMCFEFIPEEPEPPATQELPTTTHFSPLDEIRQLATELASVGSIEQN
jgi:KGK domain